MKREMPNEQLQVWRGNKKATSSGLTKNDLVRKKDKYGVYRIHSKAQLKAAKKNNNGWTKAVQKAKKKLGLKGMILVQKDKPVAGKMAKVNGAMRKIPKNEQIIRHKLYKLAKEYHTAARAKK